MNKSVVARTVGFVAALGASAALVGAGVSTTGAYFTASKDGSINASTGHVRVYTGNTTLNFDSLLPGEYKSQTIEYQTDGTGLEDVWLVFPTDGTASLLNGGTGSNSLGRFGHLKISSPDGTFVSNNLTAPGSSTDKCFIDANGHGGDDRVATRTGQPKPNDVTALPYCAPANAILLQGNMPAGAKGTADIEFGYTQILRGGQDASSALVAPFKIVATQHGIRPDNLNN